MQPVRLRLPKEPIMHRILLAALALAAPVNAQTLPQPPVPESHSGIPNTALSNEPVPSTGPHARQSNRSRSNNASIEANTSVQPRAVTPIAAGSTIVFQPAPPPSEAYPAPGPLDSYPVCHANQFDKCIEPGARKAGGKRPMRHR